MSADEEIVRPWKHRKGDRYLVLMGQIEGNVRIGFETIYYPGSYADTLSGAKRKGFVERESDDFNIGAIRGGRLVAMLWMNEIVDDDPSLMDAITEQMCGLP